MEIRTRKEKFFLALTLLRIVLAFLVGVLIISERRKIALLFFSATALASFLEGLISRRIMRKSLVKSIMDFLADRLLIDMAIITLTINGMLPVWIMVVFLLRDLLTIAIAFILFFRDYRREFKPTALGKISLFFQTIAIIPALLNRLDPILMWIAIAVTLAAGIESLFKSEFRLVRRKRDHDEFRMFRLLKFADVFTLTNVVFGIISILFALKKSYVLSSIMLILAVIADYFDGKFARVTKQQNEFGKELDSLADTVSFGVAPAIFGFLLIDTPLAILCFTIFLFCGILRLARYNIMNVKGYFQGMPITLNGVIIPTTYLLGTYYLNIPLSFYPYLYLSLGILMISSIKIRKF